MRVILLIVAVALGGCTKSKVSGPPASATKEPAPPPDPTPPPVTMSDADFAALMDEFTTFMEKVAAAIEGSGKDCAAMAAGIDQVTADHADLMERTSKMNDPAMEDRIDAWMDANGQRIQDLGTRVSQAIRPCVNDEAVRAALQRVGA